MEPVHEVLELHLVFFQKRRLQCFISEILRMVSLLGEKFIFFNSIGTTKILIIFRLSVSVHVVLLQNNLNYDPTLNIREVIKYYNLGGETDLQFYIQTALFFCIVHSMGFVTIGSCNHLMRIISTYVGNTKKSEIS